jgi:DNA repair photolyase
MTTSPNSGRGASINPKSKYLKSELVFEHPEGLDEAFDPLHPTTYLLEYPKKIVNRIDSPDIPTDYSVNPYQGCEHGCAYCYARNTHAYWGMSPGLDFEQKIIVKPEAPRLLEAELRKRNWKPAPIMLSGNTDCYQPAERHWKITRQLLEVALKFRNPVGIITKNKLVLRDLDLLQELAALELVHVYLSITSLDEKIRRMLEPRTVTGQQRLETVRRLRKAGIPAGIMLAPVIPGINAPEIPAILEVAAAAGALQAGMTIVRLNDAVADVFTAWVREAFPDRAEKVLNQIAACHGGSLSDSRFGMRMTGEGNIADSIRQLFRHSVRRFLSGRSMPAYNLGAFRVPEVRAQLQLDLFPEA